MSGGREKMNNMGEKEGDVKMKVKGMKEEGRKKG